MRNARAKLLIPIGLIAGFAYAIKYTGGVAIVYAIAFVTWKSWRSREVQPALNSGLDGSFRRGALGGEELAVGS